MDDVLKIAIGVFIGALAAAFTWEGIQTLRVKVALEQAAIDMRKAAAAEEERTVRRSQARYEQQRQKEIEADQRDQQARELQKLEFLRRQDKEEAFKRFFQPTAACKADPIQAECANAHIKAKTIFESQYVPAR